MDTNKELTFKDASMAVVDAARRNPQNNGLQYAATYAKAGIKLAKDAQKVQALYILNNISTWRGEEAKRVRAFFKEFAAAKD